MPYTLTIGDIRVHILNDGQYTQDGGGFFGLVPRSLWQRVITPGPDNTIPAVTRCLLIESEAGLILVDNGWGDKLPDKMRAILDLQGRGRITAQLAEVGYQPDDVEIVVMSHLHNDHVGGSTQWETEDGSEGPLVPLFPNARHIVQRIDLADASFPNERTRATYFADNWLPLQARGLLDIVDGPQQLAAGVRTEIAPGHTDALQVVWVESGGESLLFLGDGCSWAAHMERLAWVPAFDIYPMTSIETKRRLRHEALKRDALLLFQHDAQIVTARLHSDGDRIRLAPEIREIPDWPPTATQNPSPPDRCANASLRASSERRSDSVGSEASG